MKTKKIFVIILLLGFALTAVEAGLFAGIGTGVDLTKIQKKEEERRKKAKESKVFTDKDLKEIKKEKVNFTEITPDPNETTNTGEKKAEETPPDPKQTETYWKARKKALEANINEVKSTIKQEEEKLAKLWSDYYSYSYRLDDLLLLQRDIQATSTKIENYRRGLESLNKAMDELYDEARKAGAPPGWLRD